MIVRRESDEDQEAIRAVHVAAFGDGAATEAAEARLVTALRDDGDAVPAASLVAMVDDEVVGHVMCSRATADGRALLGLGPLGVLPAYQRRGVGHALMHGMLAAADALEMPAVALLGEPAYYRRFGFVLAEQRGLLPPDPRWAGHFQVRPLSRWDGSVRGTFRYAPAFARL